MTTTNKTEKIIIFVNNRYIEQVSKRGDGITTILWTGNPDNALRVADFDAFIKKYGLQHAGFEIAS